jgi:hypothetical protein
MNPTSFMHIFKKKQNVCKVRLLWVILYYFLGLSFRDTSKALSPFVKKKKSCFNLEVVVTAASL